MSFSSYVARVAAFHTALTSCRSNAESGDSLEVDVALPCAVDWLRATGPDGRNVFVIGNGGSASIASHVVNDLVNVGRLRGFALHDASLLTCMANDYGYSHAYSTVIERVSVAGDILIAISSSGRSANILNAVTAIRARGGKAITLSGFAADNPLRLAGHLNFWIDSTDYGFVEIAHQFVLHTICDALSEPRVTN